MNTIKKLCQASKLVRQILENDKRARNSDSHLYLQVLYQVGQIKGIDVNAISVTEFIKKRDELGIPSYKTVCRTRRDLQHNHPELRGSKAVEKLRKEEEIAYKAYATRKKI